MSIIAAFVFISGIMIPTVLLIILSAMYILNGNPIQMTCSANSLLPNFEHINTFTVLRTFILLYAGIEASALHVNEL